jgi:hypothetical protein
VFEVDDDGDYILPVEILASCDVPVELPMLLRPRLSPDKCMQGHGLDEGPFDPEPRT